MPQMSSMFWLFLFFFFFFFYLFLLAMLYYKYMLFFKVNIFTSFGDKKFKLYINKM